ncbi:MAG TPA: PAS domain S-box protein [Acetobacteraceae bacterium]|nr:PAS domain S-box protein [Acetobacteraceae bacterium]
MDTIPDQIGRFLEAVPAPTLLVDSAGKIVLANSAAAALFGCDPDELGGRAFELLLLESLRPRWTDLVHRCVAATERPSTGPERDYIGLRKDGSVIPIGISLKPWELFGELSILISIAPVARGNAAAEQVRLVVEAARMPFSWSIRAARSPSPTSRRRSCSDTCATS